ncbi:MAG: SCO6880 family protein, partial [Streptosporangiaceae bacterium]
MTVYGASAARDRHGWFFGLTGPQVFLLLGAGVPCWLAMAIGEWAALLGLVPLWALAAGLICIPVRGWSAAQWVGVVSRHLVGRATGWIRWQSAAAAGDIEDPGEADLPGVLAGIQ